MMYFTYITTQKIKFSNKDFLSKCDQIRSFCKKLLLRCLTGF